MVQYRRNFLPGGTYFFTVTLADRRSTVLVDHVAELRAAFRVTHGERPFGIDAIVILPDHLHAIFTLPPGDADFTGRWRRIKGHFSSALIDARFPDAAQLERPPLRYGRVGFGSIPFATLTTLRGTSITSTSIRSSTAWCRAWPTGRIRRFIATCRKAFCRSIGPVTPPPATVTSANPSNSRSPHERSDMRDIVARPNPACRCAHAGYIIYP